MADGEFHLVRFVMDRLFADSAPYNAREIAVVLAIVRHMDRVTRACFPAYDRISRQTRVSRRDISRILQRHCDESAAPLLARKFTKERKSYLYELVLNPEDFAKARDAQPKREKRPRRPRKAATKQSQVITGNNLPRPLPSLKLAKREKPAILQCNCGAQVARWPDGRVDNMAGLILTTEPHVCPHVPNGPTNTSEAEMADVPVRPTNTSDDEMASIAAYATAFRGQM